MLPSRRLQFCRLFLAFAALALSGPCGAADEIVKFRITPEQISLQPGLQRLEVLLIAEISDARAIEEARLQPLLPAGLTANIRSAPTLPRKSPLVWAVEIAATENAAKESAVLFRLDYAVGPAQATDRKTGTIVASAKVGYAPLSLTQSIKVSVQHGFDMLRPSKPGVAFLVIENTSIQDATLDRVDARTPTFIKVLPEETLPANVPGRSNRWIPITIETTERVRSGTSPMLLSLTFSQGSGTGRGSAAIGVIDPLTIGVPGLSDIKTAFQIPSLFLLPGLLIVLTWGLIWRLQSQVGGREFPLSARGGEFYLVSITLSLCIAFAYPIATRQPMDFLDSVSTFDIGVIWFGCIFVLAPTLYAIGFYGSKGWQQLKRSQQEVQRRRNNPLPTDAPLAILEKLASTVGTLQLASYNVEERLLFKVGFGEPESGHSWVVSRIQVKTQDSNLRGEIDECLATRDLPGLVLLLTKSERRCEIGWEGGERPRQIADNLLSAFQGCQSVVQRV